MVSDPNWLYSAVAQSSAALVAIIGAFLISRSVELASRREGFIRRQDRLREEESEVEKDLKVLLERKNHQQALRIRIEHAELELWSIQRDLRHTTADLEMVRQPPLLWPGVFFLSMFAALGVALPLTLMASLSYERLALPENRAVALSGFGLGVLMLVAYLVLVVKRIVSPIDSTEEA